MNKHIIPILVILLFIVSAVSPMVIGFKSDAKPDVDSEMEELLDNLAYYCYGVNGFDSAKYEYYNEQMLKDYLDDDIEIVEDVVQPVKPVSSVSSGPMDSPWPMQCYDTHHTGRSPYNTYHIDDLEKWRYDCEGSVDSSPIIDNDGSIYFGDSWWYIHALYPNGTLKWNYEIGGRTTSAPALAEDGTLYVGSWGHYLHSFNSTSGIRNWKFHAISPIDSSPVIGCNGIVYFGVMGPNDEGRIYAVYPNGTEKWHYDTDYSITSDPAIGDDGTIYIGSGDKYLYAINPNGTLKWRFKTGDHVMGSPSIAEDGTIYTASWDGYLYAFYPTNGTVKWKCRIGAGSKINPSIAEDGAIYIGCDKLYAVLPNGTNKWSFDLGEDRLIIWSSPAISSEGTIYFGTNIGDAGGGEIIAVNPNGTEKWRKRICSQWCDSSPAIAEDGTVYIGSSDLGGGYLHAFGPVESNSPPETPTISGETNGEADKGYWYTFRVVDSDLNPISFYIDWDDGNEGWKFERASGENCYYKHTWLIRGDYTIRCKAKDTLGEESDWAYLEVTMPKNQNMQFGWLERFPILQKILDILRLNN